MYITTLHRGNFIWLWIFVVSVVRIPSFVFARCNAFASSRTNFDAREYAVWKIVKLIVFLTLLFLQFIWLSIYSWNIFGGTEKLYKYVNKYTSVDGEEQYWNYQLLINILKFILIRWISRNIFPLFFIFISFSRNGEEVFLILVN